MYGVIVKPTKWVSDGGKQHIDLVWVPMCTVVEWH